MQLRDYQTDIVNKIYYSMQSGNKHPLVAAPCGSGKTCIFCDIASKAQDKEKHVIVLVHRQELYKQTIDTFKKSDIPLKTIQVHMAITYSNHLSEHQKPDLIITDEAHFSMANTWRKIYDYFPDVFVIGFSATCCRLDGKPLGDVYDDLIQTISIKELTGRGFLAPFRYFAPCLADLSALKTKGREYDLDQAESLLMEKAIYGDVIENYRKYADGKTTVIYCSTVKHSIKTAEVFNEAGYKTEHIDGTTPANDRKLIIDRFRSGKTKILCNVDIVSVGFDLSDIECCIMLRPTQSTALFVQQSGRALRPAEGKTAIILDHVGNYTRHGLPDDDRQWSLDSAVKPESRFKADGTLKVKQCLSCYGTFEAGPNICPYCGAEIQTTREEIKMIEAVKLEEIRQRKELRMEQARIDTAEKVKDKTIYECRSLFECQQWAKSHGKSAGFGYVMAKRMNLVRG